MQYFSARIRLGGLVHNEVPKHNLSAAEVVLLRREHGADAIVGIEMTGGHYLADFVEVERLRAIYGENKVEALFGPPDMPRAIPQFLHGFEEGAEPVESKPKVGRPRKKTEKVEQTESEPELANVLD